MRGIAQFGRGYQGARDGFVYVYFGFSRANELLVEQGADPIDWRLDQGSSPPAN